MSKSSHNHVTHIVSNFYSILTNDSVTYLSDTQNTKNLLPSAYLTLNLNPSQLKLTSTISNFHPLTTCTPLYNPKHTFCTLKNNFFQKNWIVTPLYTHLPKIHHKIFCTIKLLNTENHQKPKNPLFHTKTLKSPTSAQKFLLALLPSCLTLKKQ